MPLLSTFASATAKAYGFSVFSQTPINVFASGVTAAGFVNSVLVPVPTSVSVNLTGVQSTANVGSVTVTILDPVIQYWAAISKTTSGSSPEVVTYSVDVFSFTDNPSPAISPVSSDTVLGTTYPEQSVAFQYPQIASTDNGRTYVALTYDDTTTPTVTPSRIVNFDLSTGSTPVVSTSIELLYETSGDTRFKNLSSVNVRPDGTAIGFVYNYLNSSGQTRSAWEAGSINSDGTSYTKTNSFTFFQNADVYSYSRLLFNPVYDNFFIVISSELATPSLRITPYSFNPVAAYGATSTLNVGVPISAVWSNSGIYLAMTLDSGGVQVLWVFKFNPDSPSFSQIANIGNFPGLLSDTTIVGWTVDDASIIFSSGYAVRRTGDTFTSRPIVTAPGINSFPAFNYNGSYLFSASHNQTNTENLKVYENGGLNLIAPAVISTNNSGKEYRANAAYPRFNGEG